MPASAARLPPSTPCPAHCRAIARMRASNSGRRRISACRSGSATSNSPAASMATSIRSRCPALLRLSPAVAAIRPSEAIEADFTSGPERRLNRLVVESFDDFVGERHQIRRQLNPGGLCGFQIDDERIACRLLERQIAWLGALEDPGDQVARALERFLQVRAI